MIKKEFIKFLQGKEDYSYIKFMYEDTDDLIVLIGEIKNNWEGWVKNQKYFIVPRSIKEFNKKRFSI